MDGSIVGALVGVSALVIINIAVVSYGYGKLSQKLEDACRRLVRLEAIHNHSDRR